MGHFWSRRTDGNMLDSARQAILKYEAKRTQALHRGHSDKAARHNLMIHNLRRIQEQLEAKLRK